MPTRTGNLLIGLRRGTSDWQKDLGGLARWAGNVGYEVMDLRSVEVADLEVVRAEGLRVGSVDLIDMGRLLQADGGARKELVARNVAHIRAHVAAGVKAFFTVLIFDPPMSKAEATKVAVEVMGELSGVAAAGGAAIALEGWPGPAPHYPALGCSPESVRLLDREIASPGFGLNFDPSHLVRLGISPVRFLREFAPLVRHAHGKDTQLYPDAAYDFGLYQPAHDIKPHGFGAHTWRYTIPGHGVVDWTACLSVLAEVGYAGAISVELEDENFNGTAAGEKGALTHSLHFLRSV